MANTVAQLQKQNNLLKKENELLLKELEKVRMELNSKIELCDALFQKHETLDPERGIVQILSGLQIPEQVSVLKQVAAKKLLQLRTAEQKAMNAATFYKNNIVDLQTAFTRAASGDIVLPPEAH